MFLEEKLENVRNTLHLKLAGSVNTEELYKLQNKPSFTGFIFYDNRDCFTCRNQAVASNNQFSRILCIEKFSNTDVKTIQIMLKLKLEPSKFQYMDCACFFLISKRNT